MTILYLDSDSMGSNNIELGKKLCISFLKQIVVQEIEINAVFCLNEGARLTTTNEQAVELLKQLEDRGTVVSTCGTCLEFFDVKDQLKVGEAGSMQLYASLINKAKKVIRL